MAKLAVLMSELVQRYEIENLTADEQGRYTLTFDDDLEVQCFEKFDLIHLIASLGHLPQQQTQVADWLRHLLHYALMRLKHHTSTPTLDENNRVLLFERFETSNINSQDFEEKLEQYVNGLEEYQRFLSQDRSSSFSISGQVMFKP